MPAKGSKNDKSRNSKDGRKLRRPPAPQKQADSGEHVDEASNEIKPKYKCHCIADGCPRSLTAK
jgi:hypothetical protein